MTQPLMPMATAVWLVDNTSLTFKQIAEFCDLHELEVQGIADGLVASNIVGMDPVANSQLAQAELDRCQGDPKAHLQLKQDDVPTARRTKGPRYTPVSKRQDKPDAIAWLLRHHPELSDAQVSRLVGTTKPTIQSIRDRSHWNSANIKPVDPVALGLCKQLELDEAVAKAAGRRTEATAEAGTMTAYENDPSPAPEPATSDFLSTGRSTETDQEDDAPTVESVFGPQQPKD
ncbi:cytoplasmic protein [Rhodothalassium salexigens]|uniref:DUF1013 domain-containing protein n=1 Tax=Rhodothalassium salexigens TaxID=1086 RepID=UPI0019136108|nr:cell cycle transcriptional regulator TrcR [Rhodothalassium salexigens]MBK5920485.1 cytoplasmic protein [Rhodothalassium salexigens]